VTGDRTSFASIALGGSSTTKITARWSEGSSTVVLVKVGEDADIEDR